MADNPPNVHDLIRRALKAQLELGGDDVIIATGSGKARTVAEAIPAISSMPVETIIQPSFIKTEEPLLMPKVSPKEDLTAPLGEAHFTSLEDHYAAINGCIKCPLNKSRNKFVYGVGSSRAKLMFVGEAPGAQEDLQGEPFVGAAGKLLDRILAAIQLTREEVYIANILKCRPPNNRDPLPAEVAECLPHLHEQIRIIQPKLMMCLGRIAAQSLLQTTAPLGKLRKVWHNYHGVPMLVTFHPAALLRFPEYKKETWEDMKLLKAQYDQV